MLINGISRSPSRQYFNHAFNDVTHNLKSLSSGKRLNSAADNPAAMAIYKELEANFASHSQAGRNISYGGSLTSIADSAMAQQGEILGRMHELAIQSGNGALDTASQAAIQNELSGLREEFDRISNVTEYNGQPLLQGGPDLQIQAGIDGDSNSQVSIPLPDTQAASMGLGTLDLSSQAGAQSAISTLEAGISLLGSYRASVGASANRLGFAESSNELMGINKARSASVIGDTDMAEETSSLTRKRVNLQMSLKAQEQELNKRLRGGLINLIA